MTSRTNNSDHAPRLAIALVSGTALAYEILLLRLFAIIQWHHFAYMVISLALLGYGASGTFVALARRWLLRRFQGVYLCSVILYGLAALFCFIGAQRIPFHPEELIWNPWQPLRLLAIYLILALPFFLAATSTALALAYYRHQVATLYGMDLLGAGLGSGAVIGLLSSCFPVRVLILICALALLAAPLAWWEFRGRWRGWALAFFMLGIASLPWLPSAWPLLQPSPYKEQSQALRLEGTKIMAQRSSPLGLLTVIASPLLPWRHAPGLSLQAAVEPPAQLGLFVDGSGMSAINNFSGDLAPLAYLDQLTSALPYHIATPRRVLILGAGGGSDILQALYFGAAQVEAVELNPQVVSLVQDEFATFSGAPYQAPGVSAHITDTRAFLRRNLQEYDLIQMAMVDAFGAAGAGLHALQENYLYTVEAFQDYWRHLSAHGALAISRWLKVPPRDSLKLLATARTALERQGVAQAADHLILIRGLQTSTILVTKKAVSEADIARLRTFCRERAFDLAYYPGIEPSEANRFNQLSKPSFYLGAQALLGDEAADYIDRYKFNLTPASDDKPFFFHFLKWQSIEEIMTLRDRGGMALMEWGYLVLLVSLIQAGLASIILIVLPLLFVRTEVAPGRRLCSVVVYFFALGLAFLFLELTFIQKFILFLGHPLYAATVVLVAFLLFAGLGSIQARDLMARRTARQVALMAIAGIATIALLYLGLLSAIFHLAMHWPLWARVGLALAIIAPLAFAMGMPFPLGLARLGSQAPALIPWAWGINGCASVISAMLATLGAVHCGFSTVVVAAVMLYGLAAWSFPE